LAPLAIFSFWRHFLPLETNLSLSV
jgi:hypothetical protein